MKPRKIVEFGRTVYYLNNQLHREDGPAVEWDDGSKEWWFNNQLHRCDGPAFEGSDGLDEWFINGVHLTNKINKWFEDTGFNHQYYKWTREEKFEFKLVWG